MSVRDDFLAGYSSRLRRDSVQARLETPFADSTLGGYAESLAAKGCTAEAVAVLDVPQAEKLRARVARSAPACEGLPPDDKLVLAREVTEAMLALGPYRSLLRVPLPGGGYCYEDQIGEEATAYLRFLLVRAKRPIVALPEGVGVVIPIATDGARVGTLGFRGKHGLFEMPGGHLEPNELPADAASREVFEETGLRVPPSALRRLWGWAVKRPDGTFAVVHQYLAPFITPAELSSLRGGEATAVCLSDAQLVEGSRFPAVYRLSLAMTRHG